MTPQRYFDTLQQLGAFVVVQQKVVAAVAKQHGVTSYQYKQEFEKEAKMIVNLYPQEMALLWEFRTACYIEKVKQIGKESVIAEIIKEGKSCTPEYKDGWRNVYQQIKQL